MALIHIGGKSYELVHDNRNGWNPEAFRSRYSEVLERYDYIIGDWGYNQLRLKGFFRDNHQKANRDSSFSGISDYINEYCNFGCAYFMLEKKQGAAREPEGDDLDLNEMPAAVIALDGMDLRAAAETAATTAGDRAINASSKEAIVLPQRNRHRYQPKVVSDSEQQESSNQGQGRNGGEGRGGRDSRQGHAQGEGRKRDHHHRKGNNRNHEHKPKKPPRTAGGETAAASESGRNNKDGAVQKADPRI